MQMAERRENYAMTLKSGWISWKHCSPFEELYCRSSGSLALCWVFVKRNWLMCNFHNLTVSCRPTNQCVFYSGDWFSHTLNLNPILFSFPPPEGDLLCHRPVWADHGWMWRGGAGTLQPRQVSPPKTHTSSAIYKASTGPKIRRRPFLSQINKGGSLHYFPHFNAHTHIKHMHIYTMHKN